MDVTQTITQTMKDTAYVAVGFGVLGFQRAQVARRELTDSLNADTGKLQASVKAQVEDVSGAVEAQLSEVKTQLAKAVTNLEETLEPVARELEGRLDGVEERLPEQVKAVVASARQVAELAAAQVRSLLAA
jgi:NAD(P)H-dependent FMN reductase